MLPCVTCDNNTDKYKCPKCERPYCSVKCYTEHKTIPCEPITPIDSSREQLNNQHQQKTVMFITEDTADQSKLNELNKSDALKQLLYNPHLRKLLTEIDQAPDAWKAMKVAMMEPLFIEFADECLKVVEPAERYPDDEFL